MDETELQRLQRDALESMGHLKRLIAERIVVPDPDESTARHFRCHKLSVTAVTLTSDDTTVYSVSKDGSIVELDSIPSHRSSRASMEALMISEPPCAIPVSMIRSGFACDTTS